jgi:hypothetical protein
MLKHRRQLGARPRGARTTRLFLKRFLEQKSDAISGRYENREILENPLGPIRPYLNVLSGLRLADTICNGATS